MIKKSSTNFEKELYKKVEISCISKDKYVKLNEGIKEKNKMYLWIQMGDTSSECKLVWKIHDYAEHYKANMSWSDMIGIIKEFAVHKYQGKDFAQLWRNKENAS